jgi:putative aldouronate transport system permease protein
MLQQRRFFDLGFNVLLYGSIAVSMALIIYPLYFIVIASISNPFMVANGEVFFLPKDITFGGFQRIFQDNSILIGYRNTLFYTVAGTLFKMLVTIPAAYALSRKDFMPRRPLMFIFVFTMYFNGGMIPTYLLIKDLNMLDTVWVMIIPFAVNVTNLIIARSFFETSIPQELLDSAAIDGCNNTQFFLKIVLPISKSILSVIALFYMVQHWNEFFSALLYLKDRDLFSLQLIIRDILVMNQTASASASASSSAVQIAEQVKFAVIIVSTLPMLLVYPFIQKYFIKGVMIGAVKG